MNLYDKIEQLYNTKNQIQSSANSIDNQLLKEMIQELREIKSILLKNRDTAKKVDRNLMEFIKEFRQKMKADVYNNIYPEVKYNGKILGVDNRGLLYDKSTQRILPREEAFEVYRYFYDHQESI